MVHPWGIDDGQGWNTPEPAGVADFCTPEKNHLAGRHTREVINPFLKSLRGKVAFVMYSLPGDEDPIRKKLYRSFTHQPTEEERREGAKELTAKLQAFATQASRCRRGWTLSADKPVIDYFQQFPGLDAGPSYNNAGFWDLPIPGDDGHRRSRRRRGHLRRRRLRAAARSSCKKQGSATSC